MINEVRIEYLALVAEIIGAFAVVVSVIYLAVQISDNIKGLEEPRSLQCVVARAAPDGVVDR